MDPNFEWNCRFNALKIAAENNSDATAMVEDAEKLYLFLVGKPQITEDEDTED